MEDLDYELIFAARDNRIDDINRLLNVGANIHVQDDEPLKLAAIENNAKAVELLLKHGAQLNEDLLLQAFDSGANDSVKTLILNGADVTVGNNRIIKDLSFYGYLDLVKLALEHGADPAADENDPIVSAAFGDSGPNFEIMKVLLLAGADINALPPEWYETPVEVLFGLKYKAKNIPPKKIEELNQHLNILNLYFKVTF